MKKITTKQKRRKQNTYEKAERRYMLKFIAKSSEEKEKIKKKNIKSQAIKTRKSMATKQKTKDFKNYPQGK